MNYTGNLVQSLNWNPPTPFSLSFQNQTASTPRRPFPSVLQMKLQMWWRSRGMWMSVSCMQASCASTNATMSGAPIAVNATKATSCSKTDTPVNQVLYSTFRGWFPHNLTFTSIVFFCKFQNLVRNKPGKLILKVWKAQWTSLAHSGQVQRHVNTLLPQICITCKLSLRSHHSCILS